MSQLRLGVDYRDDGLYLAIVERSDQDLRVRRLEKLSDWSEVAPLLSEVAEVRVSVPDSMAMVKELRLPEAVRETSADVAKFELARSLLEEPSKFRFDTVAAGESDRFLGLVYREDSLQTLLGERGIGELPDDKLACATRGLGLARGYLGFCERAAGDLLCVADLNGGTASVCLVYKHDVVELARLDTASFDLDTEQGRSRFAVDLRTIVNFKRASLVDRGVTLPLAALLVTGTGVTEELRPGLSEHFPAGVEVPQLTSQVAEAAGDGLDPLLFLPALGLAAY